MAPFNSKIRHVILMLFLIDSKHSIIIRKLEMSFFIILIELKNKYIKN